MILGSDSMEPIKTTQSRLDSHRSIPCLAILTVIAGRPLHSD